MHDIDTKPDLYRIHEAFMTGNACQQGTFTRPDTCVCPLLGVASSTECYTTSWRMTIYSDTLHWSDITPIFDPVTDLNLITEFDFTLLYEVSIEHLQRVRHANRGRLLLRTPGTCMCSYVETNLSWTCLVSGLLSFEHPSVLLFCPCIIWSNFYQFYSKPVVISQTFHFEYPSVRSQFYIQ